MATEDRGGIFGFILSLVLVALAIFGGYTLYERVTSEDQVVIVALPGEDATRTTIVERATASAVQLNPLSSRSTSVASEPTSTRTHVSPEGDCEGAAAWVRGSIARSNAVVEDTQSLVQSAEAGAAPSRQEFETYLEFLNTNADAQEASSPPPAGAGLQAALMWMYQMNIERAENGLANLPEPHSELEILEQADRVTARMQEFDDKCLR